MNRKLKISLIVVTLLVVIVGKVTAATTKTYIDNTSRSYNIYFTLSSSKAYICSKKANSSYENTTVLDTITAAYNVEDFEVPDSVYYNSEAYPVAGIFNGAFANCTTLKKVTIKSNVNTQYCPK